MPHKITISILISTLLLLALFPTTTQSNTLTKIRSLTAKNIKNNLHNNIISNTVTSNSPQSSDITSLGDEYGTPEWSIGDNWVYTADFEYKSSPIEIDGKIEDYSQKIITKEANKYVTRLGGEAHGSASLFSVIPSGSFDGSLSGSTHLDTTDLSYQKFIINSTGNIPGGSYDVDTTLIFSPSLKLLDFPLQVGKNWHIQTEGKLNMEYVFKSIVTKRGTDKKSFSINEEFQCKQENVNVNTNAGTFNDALLIEIQNSKNLDMKIWYSPSVGNVAKWTCEYHGKEIGTFKFDLILDSFEYTGNQPPYTPHTPTPQNKAQNIPLETELTWEGGDPDNDDVISYNVHFGKREQPPKIDTISHPADQTHLTYELQQNLESNTTYHWQIIATDNHQNTKTGTLWSFTTTQNENDNQPPARPKNPSPPHQAKNISLNTNISWTGGDPNENDTVTYNIYFDTTPHPTTNIDSISYPGTTTRITYNMNTLQNENKYYWRIDATDNHDRTTTGPTWSFSTPGYKEENLPPNTPSRPYPENNSKEANTNGEIQWYGGDPNHNDTVTYNIYLGKKPDSLSHIGTIKKQGYVQHLTYDAGNFEGNTRYFWKITAIDDNDARSTGPLWKFTTKTDDDQPPTVFIKKPANATVYINDQPRFNQGLITLGPHHPVIIGPITLEVLTADNVEGEIMEVSILIDDHAVYTSTDPGGYYTWRWDEPTKAVEYHWHTIQVMAWDTMGNRGTTSLRVWKLF